MLIGDTVKEFLKTTVIPTVVSQVVSSVNFFNITDRSHEVQSLVKGEDRKLVIPCQVEAGTVSWMTLEQRFLG